MNELYKLPNGWKWKKLDDVTTELSSKNQALQCHDKPYLSLENIESFTGNIINYKTVKESNIIGTCSNFNSNSVIYSKLRPYLNKVATPNFDGVGTTELIVFLPKENLQKQYLAHFLRSGSVVAKIDASSYGAKMPRASSKFLRALDIPIPPLSEQQQIVSKIDLLFNKIDKSIELHQKNMDEANAFMGSVLNEVFGELVVEKNVSLKEITTKIGSGATPSGGEKSYKTDGISLIRSMNVHDGGFRFRNLAFIDEVQAKKLNNVTVEVNDVLLNITGASVARCCIVDESILPARVNQHVSILRLKDEMYPKFLHYYLISPSIKSDLLFSSSGGATREAITKNMIESFIVPLPPLPIQQKVVEYLDTVSEKMEKVKSIQKEKMESLKALKASILDRAFRGEL